MGLLPSMRFLCLSLRPSPSSGLRPSKRSGLLPCQEPRRPVLSGPLPSGPGRIPGLQLSNVVLLSGLQTSLGLPPWAFRNRRVYYKCIYIRMSTRFNGGAFYFEQSKSKLHLLYRIFASQCRLPVNICCTKLHLLCGSRNSRVHFAQCVGGYSCLDEWHVACGSKMWDLSPGFMFWDTRAYECTSFHFIGYPLDTMVRVYWQSKFDRVHLEAEFR